MARSTSDAAIDSRQAIARGLVAVTPNALTPVVSAATISCAGVVGIAAQRLNRGRAVVLDSSVADRGIVIRLSPTCADIEVYVVLDHGRRISDVGQAIIHAVGTAIGNVLDGRAVRVNVRVQGLLMS